MKRRFLPILGLFLMLGGCGYQWRSTYREDVKSVAIPLFENRSYEKGPEIALTKAIASQLELHSPYKVMDRDRADTILEGEIDDISIKSINRDINTNVPQEKSITLTLDFQWRDLRTGEVLLTRRNFQQVTTYYPTLGEGEFVGTQQAIERLALQVVQEMEADW